MLAPSWVLVGPRDDRCHQLAWQHPDRTDDTEQRRSRGVYDGAPCSMDERASRSGVGAPAGDEERAAQVTPASLPQIRAEREWPFRRRATVEAEHRDHPLVDRPPSLSLETARLAVGAGSGTNREECLNPSGIRGYRPGVAASNP
jgi:hypothetical protein